MAPLRQRRCWQWRGGPRGGSGISGDVGGGEYGCLRPFLAHCAAGGHIRIFSGFVRVAPSVVSCEQVQAVHQENLPS